MNKDSCVLELPELPYNRLEILEVFESVKEFARVKGLPWSGHGQPPSAKTSKNVVIQYGDYMIINPNEGAPCNLLAIPTVAQLLAPLNLEYNEHTVDIIWNRRGFVFPPHVDGYASSTMMWPIIPEDAGAPVDFYQIDEELVESSEYKNLPASNIFYTHHYSTQHPVIFNSHVIHGVRGVTGNRAYLRLRLNEDFASIVAKYHSGTLIKN